MIPRETLEELTLLRARVDELEEEVRLLRGEHDQGVRAIIGAMKTTVGEAKLLFALAPGTVMSRDQILRRCCHSDDGDPRLVDSMVKRCRARHPSIQFESQYGVGYRLAPASARRIRQIIKGGRDG